MFRCCVLSKSGVGSVKKRPLKQTDENKREETPHEPHLQIDPTC